LLKFIIKESSYFFYVSKAYVVCDFD